MFVSTEEGCEAETFGSKRLKYIQCQSLFFFREIWDKLIISNSPLHLNPLSKTRASAPILNVFVMVVVSVADNVPDDDKALSM